MSFFPVACDKIAPEHRIARLADFFRRKPDVTREPGRCQVCGHALPVAYRGIKILPDGKPKCIESPPGSDDAQRLEKKASEGYMDQLADDGWIFLRVSACEGLNEEVWRLAVKREEERKRKEAESLRSPARSERAIRVRGEPIAVGSVHIQR